MSQRIRSLDVLRIIAVLLVVLQHAAIFLPAAQRLNPAFLVIDRLSSVDVAVLFVVSGFLAGWHPHSPRTEAKRVASRLLIPYLCWAVFYTTMFDVEAHVQHVQPKLPDIAGILTGQGVYFMLWFLPMLIYCSLAGSLINDSRQCFVFSGVLLFGWASLAFTLHGASAPGYADSSMGFVRDLPYFLGLYLFAKGLGMSNREFFAQSLAYVIGLATLVVALDVMSALWTPSADLHALHFAIDLALSAVLALVLLLLALSMSSIGEGLPLFWASSAPYSIYLTHMLVLTAFAHFLPLIGSAWPVHLMVLTVAGFVGSSLLSAGLLRIPMVRPIFGQSPRTRVGHEAAG